MVTAMPTCANAPDTISFAEMTNAELLAVTPEYL